MSIRFACRLILAAFGAAVIAPTGPASAPLGRFTDHAGRVLMTLSRSVHEVVWGLVFVAAVGLGALARVLALAVRSSGFISKTVAIVIVAELTSAWARARIARAVA